MKTFAILALTLLLTAAAMTGCGCTNQNMDSTSAPTVLPTNEEIWNSTETTTHVTTEAATIPGTTDGTAGTETTETTRGINETEVQNHVNDYSNMVQEQMKKNQGRNATTATEGSGQNNAGRMVPGTR